MKKNIISVFSLLIIIFSFFTSCSVKEYSGFIVNQGIIKLPGENEDVLEMPLELYKCMEKRIADFADKYNYFGNINISDFEDYKNLTMSIYNLDVSNIYENPDDLKKRFSKIIDNEKKLSAVLDLFLEMDKSSLEKTGAFFKELSDNLDILIYITGEIADFDRGIAPWYKSRDMMFEDAADENNVKYSISFIEKYFPSVDFVLNYEETGAFKAGI